MLPRARSDLEFVLRKLARDMFKNWSGQRDLHSISGVGNAELYCLSYDRKTKKNKHLQTNSGRRIISAGGLSGLQESRIL